MGNVINAAENEIIRREILELCKEAMPYGAGAKILKAALKKSEYDIPDKEILLHIGYLKGKGLLSTRDVTNDRLGIKRVIAFITPEGIDYLEGNGPDIAGVG